MVAQVTNYARLLERPFVEAVEAAFACSPLELERGRAQQLLLAFLGGAVSFRVLAASALARGPKVWAVLCAEVRADVSGRARRALMAEFVGMCRATFGESTLADEHRQALWVFFAAGAVTVNGALMDADELDVLGQGVAARGDLDEALADGRRRVRVFVDQVGVGL